MTLQKTMPTDARPTRTPKLRFPEFRNQPGWQEAPLSSVLTEHEEKSDGTSEVHSVSVHKGVVNQVEHLGRSFAAADRSNYNLAKPYDLLYTKSPTGDFPYGIVKQNKLPFNVIVSPLYGVFSPLNRHLGYILDAYFESPIRASNYLAPITQKGAKNTIQISNSTFLSKGLYLPANEAEQERIAECLSTLDELMAAESQKLDALKAHKKALMQQLFPREGETIPSLRFPEFKNAGQWQNKLIGPYLEDCSGRVPPNTELPIYSSTREGLKRQDTYFDGRILQNKNEYGVVPPGCFVYRHMSDDGLFKFNINDTGGYIAVSKEYPVFSTKELSSGFLRAQLNDGPGFKEFALSKKAGGTRTRLYFDRLCEWKTLLPSLPEQRCIADCLSSLDDLIAAQRDQLEALKTHKKGLMQQLFPSPGSGA